eukprot:TRINITY_DN831_c0_g1_i1.p1 TRINITY_DN831_c0_g1~~TRINITY_DN831_c0_g1_i1.p1  ORF type:complete len:272 (-),score=1.37 TRINITY_DN831_c0_g1_i1:619-1434(-)
MLDPWYDDSDDDDYTGGVLSDECFARKVKQRKQVSSSLAAADTTHVGQQVHAMARVKAVCSGRDRGRNKKHQSKLQGGEGTSHEGNPSIMDMTETLMINVILYLSQLEKLRLQCTCRIMGRAMDSPEAWTTLDVSLATIGWATSRGGRKRKLSPSSAYHCCKEVLKQTRFGAIVSANLAGLLLGIGGNPDLLTKLLLQCPGVTSLDLTHATADRCVYHTRGNSHLHMLGQVYTASHTSHVHITSPTLPCCPSFLQVSTVVCHFGVAYWRER